MESLNLNTLVNSLPAQQNAEKELLNDFKAAALSITTLYRSSRKTAKRAYNAGYATACQDLLDFIQQGLSTGGVGPAGGPSNEVEDGGMTIGRIMDWTEARRDAIKVSEEDEDEDEEREKEKERGRSGKASTAAKPEPKKPSANVTSSTSRIPASTLPTPSSPRTSSQLPPVPSSPSPPPSTNLRPALPLRQHKVRPPSRLDSVVPPPAQISSTPSSGFNILTEHPFGTTLPNTLTLPESPVMINNGISQKRRHHVMIIEGNGSTTSTSSPGSTGVAPGSSSHGHAAGGPLARRRTRSTRNLAHAMHPHNQNLNIAQPVGEAMEVEDDGRERKRVARR